MQNKVRFGDADYPTPEQSLKAAVQRAIDGEARAAAAKAEADKQAAIAAGTWVEPPPLPTHITEWVMVASVLGEKRHRFVDEDPAAIKQAYNLLKAAYPNMQFDLFEVRTPVEFK